MKLKEGRIGGAEASAAAAISLCMNGIFAMDPAYAYEGGNSTFITAPFSVLISLLPVLLLISSMDRTGSRSLAEHMEKTLGGFPGRALAFLTAATLVLCAAMPLAAFAQVLHKLVYDGVKYTAILAFIFPAVVFIAWKGFESIGRMALCIAGLILAAFAAAVINAFPGFRLYRLYPLMGDGARHMISFSLSETLAFMPPLTALTVEGGALQGTGNLRRTASRAALVSAFVCFSAQLAIGLSYPAQTLAGMTAPLYRIGFLRVDAGYLMRLDKLFIMIWLSGAMLSAAYCIYSASRLYAGAFRQRDVTPAILVVSLVVCGLMLALLEDESGAAGRRGGSAERCGFIFILAPTLTASAAGFIKSKSKAKGGTA